MNATLTRRNPGLHGTYLLRRLLAHSTRVLATIIGILGICTLARAADPEQINTLREINFAGMPGNQVQITMELSEAATNPPSFTIDNPARIAFDLPATRSELKARSQAIGIGPAKSITAVEVKGRTRVVLNLFEMVPYETRADGAFR